MPGDYPGDRFEIKITGKEKKKIIRKGYEESKRCGKDESLKLNKG